MELASMHKVIRLADGIEHVDSIIGKLFATGISNVYLP